MQWSNEFKKNPSISKYLVDKLMFQLCFFRFFFGGFFLTCVDRHCEMWEFHHMGRPSPEPPFWWKTLGALWICSAECIVSPKKIWVNYNNSLTWILRPYRGWIPFVKSWFPGFARSELVIIYPERYRQVFPGCYFNFHASNFGKASLLRVPAMLPSCHLTYR